jgi:hypothetical protein
MKRWAVLTVLLYALALILLTAPALLLAFGWNPKNGGGLALKDVFDFLKFWGYWLWLAVLVAGQALLLLLPIRVAEKRLPARRKLKIPVIVTAFFLANLFAAGIFSVACAIFLDNAFYAFSFVDWLLGHKTGGTGQPQTLDVTGWGVFLSVAFTLAVFWFLWAMIFRQFAKADDPNALLKRALRWLLRGSILELIIAVPSHVIVRRRDDCCAPMGTFWGIATGISVMLLCFGPGVFFLFVERCRRLQAKPSDAESPGTK